MDVDCITHIGVRRHSRKRDRERQREIRGMDYVPYYYLLAMILLFVVNVNLFSIFILYNMDFFVVVACV